MCQVSDNYNYLNTVALRITKDRTKAKDLISETFITLHNQSSRVPNDGFVRYFSKCMKNIHTNQRSSFNKIKIKEVLTDSSNHIEQLVDSDEPKYQQIELFKTSLPLHESILFELYYEKGLSGRHIARMLTTIGDYKVGYMSIFRLIEPIKIKLNTWKQLHLSDY